LQNQLARIPFSVPVFIKLLLSEIFLIPAVDDDSVEQQFSAISADDDYEEFFDAFDTTGIDVSPLEGVPREADPGAPSIENENDIDSGGEDSNDDDNLFTEQVSFLSPSGIQLFVNNHCLG
jgi:hypothetical protein